MKRMKSFCSYLWLLIFIPAISFSQIQLLGNLYQEASIDRLNRERYFENWTEVTVQYQNWRLGGRYEMHLPPQPFSQDTSGQGIYQRFLEYRTGGLNVTVGNFYAMLGRGLTLRSFENRTLRWDTNIDGIKFDFHHRLVDLLVFSGRPRDRRGRRFETLQAGEIRLKPHPIVQLGGTYLATKLRSRGDVSWGSLFSQFQLAGQSLYLEYARKKYPSAFPKGSAFYAGGNFYWQNLNLLVEYKDYDHFDLTEGLTYNNPPSVVREHLYTLLNRHQRVQDANDEKGYLLEASYPILDQALVTANYNITRSHSGIKLYEEIYGEAEYDGIRDMEWVVGGGRQEDLGARYLNLVVSPLLDIGDFNSLKVIFEHQHITILLTDRQYYDQALQVSFARAPRFTVSLLGERTTDQFSEKDYWLGAQVDIHFLDSYDLSIFGGSRREGKICAGGVCVVRPEFEGVEFILTARF